MATTVEVYKFHAFIKKKEKTMQSSYNVIAQNYNVITVSTLKMFSENNKHPWVFVR